MLKAVFETTPCPDWEKIQELAAKLCLDECVIKTWFKNQRAQQRKLQRKGQPRQPSESTPQPPPPPPLPPPLLLPLRRHRRRRRQHARSSARLRRKSRAPGAPRRRAPRLPRTRCPPICTTSIWTPLRPGLRCLMTSGSSCACTACSMTTSQTTSRYLKPQTSRAEFFPVLEKRKRTKQSVGAPAGDLETALEGPLLCLVLYKSKCAGSLGGSLGWSEASQPGGWFSVVCGRFVMVNLDTCEVPQEDDLWGS
nr:paired-like homeodomain transcription factor LEUTX isoform X2 [Oryctolagus cuniculus]XP_051702585.1 paired-like homeodomain transcription factor LEUTX isoform X3 [Oryctolagus cuniculus]XP_051702589.1 paired-like homeodomain transcription factor LEUTX isoform X2 [Oryctolagus cuniculus]XP_051702590.1 paired-like homeodomain transcription factor LEUTX isoform X3 [Oryctolagus cuniculus]XP_051702591.1 paired-like homeodomain transcription factor LEUTX isoform X2 [Oryctolagus cuniculus]XP_0517025